MARKPRLPPVIRESARAAAKAGAEAAKGMRQAERMFGNAIGEWRRVTKLEDAAANAANRYILRSVDAYSRELAIAERQFRKLNFGVTVERAIEERRFRTRPYASQSTQRAAERAIERNEKNPIRRAVREKRKHGHRRITEKNFGVRERQLFNVIEKKSGERWRWNESGELVSESTGRAPAWVSGREYDEAREFYFANQDRYAPVERDLLRWAGGSPNVRKGKSSTGGARRRAA